MPKSLFNSLEGCDQPPRNSDAPKPLVLALALVLEEVEQVSGGRIKLPGPPVTVYYDDGITLVTSDPTKNTL
jgi:hypothetical protein